MSDIMQTPATIYYSTSCNQTSQCVDWGQNGKIAFAACHSVAIANKHDKLITVISTNVHHTDQVNCVQWIKKQDFTVAETELISGSVDKSAKIWKYNEKQQQLVHVATLCGHSGSVTAVVGRYTVYGTNTNERIICATASADSTVKIWAQCVESETFDCFQTLSFGNGFVFALAYTFIPNCQVPLLACGTDSRTVALHAWRNETKQFVPAVTLRGHEDWVRGVDFTYEDNGDLLLASCSQDTYIRIYRICAQKAFSENQLSSSKLKVKENIFSLTLNGEETKFVASLETTLQGHDGWVYGVRWHQHNKDEIAQQQPLYLLSASMDKTMITWGIDEPSGLWVEKVRVGDVGGSNPGFYGAVFSPDGSCILGHGFHGSFHIWEKNQDTWLPSYAVSGHFSSVEDLAWEPSEGFYLLTVSGDQTTRLHAPWIKDETHYENATWHEMARPQIHGHDVQCIAAIDSLSFATGAEEKVIRVFTATQNFIENAQRLTSNLSVVDLLSDKDVSSLPEGACVPALGLSNKAVHGGECSSLYEEREITPASDSQYSESYFRELLLTAPPCEEDLLQNTLWAETQKLYGHGYEIFTLAAHPRGTLLASACKATKMPHAGIILWDTSSWQQLCVLLSHSLTVTRLSFSHSGKYLLSVSRDRSWTVFEESQENEPYRRIAYCDNKSSPHSRVIWCCSWSHDDLYFITVSRDKKAVIWAEKCSDPNRFITVSTKSDWSESLTAVDFASEFSPDKRYLLAIGLENGVIQLAIWALDQPNDWSIIYSFSNSQAHHLTVKRLKFQPHSKKSPSSETEPRKQQQILASCGADHAVKIHRIE